MGLSLNGDNFKASSRSFMYFVQRWFWLRKWKLCQSHYLEWMEPNKSFMNRKKKQEVLWQPFNLNEMSRTVLSKLSYATTYTIHTHTHTKEEVNDAQSIYASCKEPKKRKDVNKIFVVLCSGSTLHLWLECHYFLRDDSMSICCSSGHKQWTQLLM
jgi:hypothetical protein